MARVAECIDELEAAVSAKLSELRAAAAASQGDTRPCDGEGRGDELLGEVLETVLGRVERILEEIPPGAAPLAEQPTWADGQATVEGQAPELKRLLGPRLVSALSRAEHPTQAGPLMVDALASLADLSAHVARLVKQLRGARSISSSTGAVLDTAAAWLSSVAMPRATSATAALESTFDVLTAPLSLAAAEDTLHQSLLAGPTFTSRAVRSSGGDLPDLLVSLGSMIDRWDALSRVASLDALHALRDGDEDETLLEVSLSESVDLLSAREAELHHAIAVAEEKLETLYTLQSPHRQESPQHHSDRVSLARLHADLVTRDAQIEDLTRTIAGLKAFADNRASLVAKVKDAKAKARAASKAAAKAKAAAEQREIMLREVIADLQDSNQVLRAELKSSQANVKATAALKASFDPNNPNDVSEYIAGVVEEYRKAAGVSSFEADKQILQAKLKAHKASERVQTLQDELAQANSRVQVLQSLCESHAAAQEDSLAQVSRLQAQVAELTPLAESGRLVADVATLTAERDALAAEKAELQAQLAALTTIV